MNHTSSKRIQGFPVMVFFLLFVALQSSIYAGDTSRSEKSLTSKHIVPAGEVRASVLAYPAVRAAQIDKVAGILDSAAARQQLSRWGIKPAQAKAALSRLHDAELEYYASRADDVMADLQGGRLGYAQIILAVLGVMLLLVLFVDFS